MFKKIIFILCFLAAFMMKDRAVISASEYDSFKKNTVPCDNLSNESAVTASSQQHPLKERKNDLISESSTKMNDARILPNIKKRVNRLFPGNRVIPLSSTQPINDLVSETSIKIDFINSSSGIEKKDDNQNTHLLRANVSESSLKNNITKKDAQTRYQFTRSLFSSVSKSTKTNSPKIFPIKEEEDQNTHPILPNASKNTEIDTTKPPFSTTALESVTKTNSPDSSSEAEDKSNTNAIAELYQLKNRFLCNLHDIALKKYSSTLQESFSSAQLKKELEINNANIIDLLTQINYSLRKTDMWNKNADKKDMKKENDEINILCCNITQWHQNQDRGYPSFACSTSLETLANLCDVNVEYAKNVEHMHLPPKLDSIFLDPPKEGNTLVLDQILDKTRSFIDNEQYAQAISKLNQMIYFFKPFTTIDIIITNQEKFDLRIQGCLLDFTSLGERVDPDKKGIAFGTDHKLIPRFILDQMDILFIGINRYIRKADNLMEVLLKKVSESSRKNEITPIKERLDTQYQIWKKMLPILSKIYPIRIPANWIQEVA